MNTRAPARLLLVVALPGLLLAGCGGGAEREEPTSYVLTDLQGGTAAPGTVVVPESTPTSPTKRRTRAPKGAPSSGVTGADLVDRVASAAGTVDSVRVMIGNGTPPPDIEADVSYADGEEYDATVLGIAGQPDVLFRRVGDAFYAGTDEGLAEVDPADPRIESAAGGIVPAFLAWSPLLDLRAALAGATDVVETEPGDVDGAATAYRFTLDLAELPRPSLIVPDQVDGPADVTLRLDADDLPVQLVLTFDAGGTGVTGDVASTVVLGYSAWGTPVDIAAP